MSFTTTIFHKQQTLDCFQMKIIKIHIPEIYNFLFDKFLMSMTYFCKDTFLFNEPLINFTLSYYKYLYINTSNKILIILCMLISDEDVPKHKIHLRI